MTGCVHGETLILVTDPRKLVSIRDLYEESRGYPFKVHCARSEGGKWRPDIREARAFAAGDKELLKISFVDGGTLRMTADHEIGTTDGELVRPLDLDGRSVATRCETGCEVSAIEVQRSGDVYELVVPGADGFFVGLGFGDGASVVLVAAMTE